MKQVTVGFDIDGTLRCNCTPTCQDTNQPVVSLLLILHKYFKNVRLIAWSGGGADYAWGFIQHHGLAKYISQARCFSKLNAPPVDIAIDDQQEFSLGKINLIVFLK